jgi:hypothetical protein
MVKGILIENGKGAFFIDTTGVSTHSTLAEHFSKRGLVLISVIKMQQKRC